MFNTIIITMHDVRPGGHNLFMMFIKFGSNILFCDSIDKFLWPKQIKNSPSLGVGTQQRRYFSKQTLFNLLRGGWSNIREVQGHL